MRTLVFSALLVAASAFATPPSGNEATGAMHSRLAAASKSRTRDDVARAFDKNKGRIHALYTRALKDNPALQGKIVLSITIVPDGRVRECIVVSSTLNDAALVKGIVEHVSAIDFGAKGTMVFSTEYPITFFPG
jgi:protein TonB